VTKAVKETVQEQESAAASPPEKKPLKKGGKQQIFDAATGVSRKAGELIDPAQVIGAGRQTASTKAGTL
jgi:hypothetical protein